MAVTRNGISAEFDWFGADYLKTEQDILKRGLDETAADREVNAKDLPHQEIYVQDSYGDDATLHLICFDGRAHLGVYYPSESGNYQEIEEKTLPEDWLSTCSMEEFQKRIIEITIPSLIERGTLGLRPTIERKPFVAGEEPLTAADLRRDLRDFSEKYRASVEQGRISPAAIKKALKDCEAVLIRAGKEKPMER